MKDGKAFVRDLEKSRIAVQRYVTALIKNTAIHAEVLPQQTRPEDQEKNRHAYADSGDFAVVMRGEHKLRTCCFDGPATFPFGTVYVDEVYKIDNPRPGQMPLVVYVIESADHKCAAVIYPWTKPYWRVAKHVWDQKQNKYCDFYEIDKKYVRFCAPEEALCWPDELIGSALPGPQPIRNKKLAYAHY